MKQSHFAGRAAQMAGLIGMVAPMAAAAATSDTSGLEQIQIIATRRPALAFDLPVAATQITQARISDQRLGVNASEALQATPGLVIFNRQNYAQDLQVSIRGFGSDSTFGVRGIRLYQDGVPGTMPDGQGEISSFDLPSAATIDVLRGPFSVLYGNSSGGVISLTTQDGQPGVQAQAGVQYGSWDTRHANAKLSGASGPVNYLLDVQDFATHGYRAHSGAERRTLNAKVGIDLGKGSKLTVVANALDIPEAQDPGGLTRAQWLANPAQAGTGSVAFNTRKHVDQQQGGIVYDGTIDDRNSLHAMIYGGHRAVVQYLSTPVATQANPKQSGGVVSLDSGYFGTDLNWSWHVSFFRVTAGMAYDEQDEARQGFNNFLGGQLGVQGLLRRNEEDILTDFDQYIEAEFDPVPYLSLVTGMRHSFVRVTSQDFYIVPGNGDDSGASRYGAMTPAVGVVWKPNDAIHPYLSYGQGFETPTLDEIAYRSTTGALPGLNFGLPPSQSEHFEAGIKIRLHQGLHIDLAGYHVTTKDELAIASNANGRAVYQDVGGTTRDGADISIADRWRNGIGVQLTYSYLRASYGNSFKACWLTPCVPVTIAAGTRMPGVPRDDFYGEVSWQAPFAGFETAVESTWRSRIYVNDADTDAAPAAFVMAWRGGFAQDWGHWALKEFLRIDNLADKKYIGSVIVNSSTGGYFEPGLPRSAYVGLSMQYRL